MIHQRSQLGGGYKPNLTEEQKTELTSFIGTLYNDYFGKPNTNGGQAQLLTAEEYEDKDNTIFYMDLGIPADTQEVELFGQTFKKDDIFKVSMDMNVFFADKYLKKVGDKLLINKVALLFNEEFFTGKEAPKLKLTDFALDPKSNSSRVSFDEKNNVVTFDVWADKQRVSWVVKNADGSLVKANTPVLIFTKNGDGSVQGSLDKSNEDAKYSLWASYGSEIEPGLKIKQEKKYHFYSSDYSKLENSASLIFNKNMYSSDPNSKTE